MKKTIKKTIKKTFIKKTIKKTIKKSLKKKFKKSLKKSANKKICFVSTYIGNKNFMEGNNNFKKNPNYDYLFFTNLDKSYYNDSSWKIVQVNINDIEPIKNIISNVKISRYFKFKVNDYITKYLGKKYDYIFYCDCWLYPKYNVNWDILCAKINKSKFGMIQYKHPVAKKGIAGDLKQIIKMKKDTVSNINKTKIFLKKISKKVDLSKPVYFENAIFGFSTKKNNVINFLEEYWKYYLNCPTYRDQPLWNFLLLKNNLQPVTYNLKSFFGGKKILNRKITHYKTK